MLHKNCIRVIIDGDKWFLKYPKSIKSIDVVNLSYTTTPLSEYIGSHIYESIGIETHKTKLGVANGKVVCACKDFLNSSEVIFDYNSIKNEYDEMANLELEKLESSSGINKDIDEVLLIMDKNPYFKSIPDLKLRFWDMFVVDAFISNNDRGEGNWGLILDKSTNKLRISPVFDNGALFYNKTSFEKLNDIYNDSFKFKQVVYDSSVSIYEKNGKIINPLKFIESIENDDCNRAILRIIPLINLDNIKYIFDSIPLKYNDINIISDIQMRFYFKTLEYRYENILLPIYNKLLSSYKGK